MAETAFMIRRAVIPFLFIFRRNAKWGGKGKEDMRRESS
jgi:hypothetical protein